MADSRQQIIGEINGEIQGAVDAFNDAIPQMEKSLVRKINLIIKDLDLNPNGTIKSTIANMKKMRTIEREMAVAFESAQYLGNVEKYTNAYDKTRAIEGKYFDKVLTDYSEPAIMNEIQSQAVSTVTKELTGSNIVANVIDPVNTLVRQGIESGMEWDDLRSSIGDFLQGVDGGVGALDRYTTTITNDALNTYARTYENTIANREGIEWYEYVGREMTNTRDFCSTLDAQRWFHQSEIKGFLKGRIGKRTVPLYRKTGKPYGMKSSTTEKNFVQLTGGWNCGHHAYPVPTHLVPQKVRDKFETGVDAVDVDDALGVDDFEKHTEILDDSTILFRGDVYDKGKKFTKNVDYIDFNGNEKNKGYNFFSNDKQIAKSYAIDIDRKIKIPKGMKIEPNITDVNFKNTRILDMATQSPTGKWKINETYDFLSEINGSPLTFDEVSKLYGFKTQSQIPNKRMWELTQIEQQNIFDAMTKKTSNANQWNWSPTHLTNFENGVHFKKFLKSKNFDGYKFVDYGGVGGVDYAIFNDITPNVVSKEIL